VSFWNRFKPKQQQALPAPESEAERGYLRGSSTSTT